MESGSEDDDFSTAKTPDMCLLYSLHPHSLSRGAKLQSEWAAANFGGYASSTSTPVKASTSAAGNASAWDSDVNWDDPEAVRLSESEAESPRKPLGLQDLLRDDSVVETDTGESDTNSSNPVDSLKLRIDYGRNRCGNTVCCSKGYAEILGTDDAVRILLHTDDDDPVSTKVPNNPDDNCIFLIDLRCVEDWRDVLSDHLGSWTKDRGGRIYHFRKVERDVKPTTSQAVAREEPLYSFERQLYRSNVSDDLKKLVVLPVSTNCDFLLLQYVYSGEPHALEPIRHKNAKTKNAAYSRTFQSTKAAIRKGGRKESMAKLNEMVHSLYDYEHPDAVPKGKSQIRMLTADSQPTENIMGVMEKCKKEAGNPSARFVQEVIPVPNLCVLLASERQLDDLVKFCTNSQNFCVMGVDTVFNIGKLYVSAATYRHLMLKSEKCPVGIHPVMVGALFVHQEKSARAYLTFAQMLKKARPELADLRAFGSDEHKALYLPLRQEFVRALQFLCDLHMRDTLTRMMRELNMTSGETLEVMDDTFGKRQGTGRTAGIVTCKLEEFDLHVETCLARWELKSEAGKAFAEYFRKYKLNEIRQCQLLENRVLAGLNLDLYNQNANECINNVIKVKADRKPKTLDEFVEVARNLEIDQTRTIEMAAMGRAEGVSLLPEYQHLRVLSADMYISAKHPTASSRQKLGSSIHRAKLKPRPEMGITIDLPQTTQPDMEHEIEATNARIGDAVDDIVSRLSNVCDNEKKAMKNKVRTIVTDQTAISKIPGNHGLMVFFVASGANPTKPHKVDATGKGGKITCDCFAHKATKICAHCVAVALAQELVDQFVAYHNRTAKTRTNLDALVEYQLPKSTAKKPSKRTQIRLGKSTPGKPVSHIAHPSGTMRLTKKTPVIPAVNEAIQRPKRKAVQQNSLSGTKKLRLTSTAGPVAPIIAPKPYECEIHFLADCRSSVRLCAGCSKALHDKRDVPKAPYDLIVVSHLERRYKQNGKVHTTPAGNAYFHARTECIRREIRDFDPSALHVSDHVTKKMQPIHRRHIFNAFNLTV